MIKKPRKWKYTLEDGDFVSTEIRVYSLESPSYFDETINALKDMLSHPQAEPGLTVVEFILRRLEGEAKKILQEFGYPTDISELVPWLQEGESFLWTDPESEKTYFHKVPSLQALSAKQVLCSVENIRYEISKNDAEETALETMRLLFAAMAADLRDTIMDGIRKSQERKHGGKKTTDKEGYYLAIKEVLKIKGDQIIRENIWRYFERFHNNIDIENRKSEPMYIGGYEIYFDPDTTENKQEDVLMQEYEGKKRVIKKGTFFKYITEIRK